MMVKIPVKKLNISPQWANTQLHVSKFFADAEESFEESKFIIFGYPYDGTACFRKGAAEAPDAIREQSFKFETNLMEQGVDIADVPANDWGDIELGANQEENNTKI